MRLQKLYQVTLAENIVAKYGFNKKLIAKIIIEETYNKHCSLMLTIRSKSIRETYNTCRTKISRNPYQLVYKSI